MTLEELYQKIDGNYQSILERLGNDDRIRKFVLLFLQDNSFQTFEEALRKEDVDEAFRAVHTLKGVCMNLSFDALLQVSSNLTEVLRERKLKEATEIMPELENCYRRHMKEIIAYKNNFGGKENV